VDEGTVSFFWFPPHLRYSRWAGWYASGYSLEGEWRVRLGRIEVKRTPLAQLTVPLWMLFLGAGVPTSVLWCLDRRRGSPGHCRACGYNLTGNVSGRCPECGQAIEPAVAEQP
jgi:hypothetical protein